MCLFCCFGGWCAFQRGGLLGQFDTRFGGLVCHQDTINAVSYSPDGRRLASASSDSTIKLWDPFSGTQVSSEPEKRNAQTIRLCWPIHHLHNTTFGIESDITTHLSHAHRKRKAFELVRTSTESETVPPSHVSARCEGVRQRKAHRNRAEMTKLVSNSSQGTMSCMWDGSVI